ncbi:MAG: hypothetical protein V4572_02665 [Bacteroidota bacterium]
MDNNNTQNHSYTNRNFNEEFQTNEFENLRLNENPDQDTQVDSKGFQNNNSYTENLYPKDRRRSYTSVFDI